MQINTQICATRGERAAAPAGLERKVLRRDGDTKKKKVPGFLVCCCPCFFGAKLQQYACLDSLVLSVCVWMGNEERRGGTYHNELNTKVSAQGGEQKHSGPVVPFSRVFAVRRH